MKTFVSFLSAAALAAVLTGCGGEKADPNAAMNNAAEALREAPAPAPAEAAPAPAVQPAYAPQPAAPVQPAVQAPPPAQQLNQAMTAYKAKDYQDAVTRLQRLRATPVMTPEQRMAVNDAIASVMSELYTLAAQGDARAAQAVKAAEAMQTRRR